MSRGISRDQEGSNQKTTGYEGLRQKQPGSDQEGSNRLKAGYEGTGLKGYTLEQGLLCYKGGAIVPAQKGIYTGTFIPVL
jgi:hypothetical protein